MRTYSKRELFARDFTSLLKFCHAKGYGVTFGEAFRTKEQQTIYYEAGLSKVKVSQHQKRLAQDLHIWGKVTGKRYITDVQWRKVGEFWECLSLKNRWGGRYGLKKKEYCTEMGWDKWHFERRDK